MPANILNPSCPTTSAGIQMNTTTISAQGPKRPYAGSDHLVGWAPGTHVPRQCPCAGHRVGDLRQYPSHAYSTGPATWNLLRAAPDVDEARQREARSGVDWQAQAVKRTFCSIIAEEVGVVRRGLIFQGLRGGPGRPSRFGAAEVDACMKSPHQPHCHRPTSGTAHRRQAAAWPQPWKDTWCAAITWAAGRYMRLADMWANARGCHRWLSSRKPASSSN